MARRVLLLDWVSQLMLTVIHTPQLRLPGQSVRQCDEDEANGEGVMFAKARWQGIFLQGIKLYSIVMLVMSASNECQWWYIKPSRYCWLSVLLQISLRMEMVWASGGLHLAVSYSSVMTYNHNRSFWTLIWFIGPSSSISVEAVAFIILVRWVSIHRLEIEFQVTD